MRASARRAGLSAAIATTLVAASAVPASERAGSEPRAVFPADVRAAAAELRRAGDAAAAGNLAAASEIWAGVAASHPELRDYLGRFEAEAWLAADRPEPAEVALRRALETAARSPIRVELEALLADVRAARGDPEGARTAWRQVLERAGDDDELRLRAAHGLAAAGDPDGAAAVYVSLWRDAPETESGAEAGAALDALEKPPERAAADHLVRADGLYEAQHSAEALASYEAALAAGLPAAERRHAERRRAHSLFRLRRYPEAVEAFTALGSDASSRVWRARALARSDRVEQSIDELEAIGRGRHGTTSAWALYLAGLLHAGRDRDDAARRHFEAVAAGPSARFAESALWQLGWLAYRTGDRTAARDHFTKLAARQRDPIERLGARYWAARALEASPDHEARARNELAAIAREYPLSYYGWRAASLPDVAVEAGPSLASPLALGGSHLPPAQLFRAQVLIAADQHAAARAELHRLRPRVRTLRDRLLLGRLLAAARDFNGAQRLIVGRYNDRLARGIADDVPELWRLAWPDAWGAELRQLLPPDARVAPELVSAVMREESGYLPEVISVSGAIGLLQIMPETGERLARDLGLPSFDPAWLRRPVVNLRLGGFYLDQLARRFDGTLPAVIASYNAGEAAVGQWLARVPDGEPDDEWVESIPYSQTRTYVKRVLRSLHAYREIY